MDNPMYQCNLCNRTFTAFEATFTIPIDGITFAEGFAVWCICKDKVIRRIREPKSTGGDRIITCPTCGSIHIHGY